MADQAATDALLAAGLQGVNPSDPRLLALLARGVTAAALADQMADVSATKAANRLMTERCTEFIGEQCLVDTFVRIAQNVGCDEKTVRTLAGECIAKLMETHKPALPAWLGIDETTIDGCLRLVLTDIKNRRPVDMLLDDSMGGLQMWLHRFKDRSHVEVVTTDMHRAYRTVVKALLPAPRSRPPEVNVAAPEPPRGLHAGVRGRGRRAAR